MVLRKQVRKQSSTPENAVGLLTTNETAALLGVHPKHMYRLLKRGLPARRVGDEWRYDKAEVLAWTRTGRVNVRQDAPAPPPPPLLAANGDLGVEALFDVCRETSGPTFGFVLSDHTTGLEHLENGSILGAGCHGQIPNSTHGKKFAWLHLAHRELGFAHRPGLRLRGISSILRYRLALRPSTAGIRRHFDKALAREGITLENASERGHEYGSHRDAVMAVVRGNAEIALSSHAWAKHAGLGFTLLVSEAYGFVFRAEHLADPRVIDLCEIAGGQHFRQRIGQYAGYDAQDAGLVSIGSAQAASELPERTA